MADHITITQSETDRALDKVAEMLAKDPRVTRIEHDSVKHYSVPDSLDRPELFFIRVYAREDDLAALRDELSVRIYRELGHQVASEVSIG